MRELHHLIKALSTLSHRYHNFWNVNRYARSRDLYRNMLNTNILTLL